jgi:hypothetical protein
MFSLMFLSLVPYVSAMKRNADLRKEEVINTIKKNNEEIIRKYDLH